MTSLTRCARSARRFSLIRVLKGTGELVYDRWSAMDGDERSIALANGLFSSVAQWQSIRLLTGGLLVRVQPEEPFTFNDLRTLRIGPSCAWLGKMVGSVIGASLAPG